MLILTRKVGESIIIGDNIEVKIVSIDGEQIKVGIEAPRHVEIHRQEVYEVIQAENRLASESHAVMSLEQLKKFSTQTRGMKMKNSKK
jgi:carbon storage regulator